LNEFYGSFLTTVSLAYSTTALISGTASTLCSRLCLYSFDISPFILFILHSSADTSDMDRKGEGERDSSKDKSPKPGITPKGSEDAMDIRGGSRQRCGSEGAVCSEDGSEHGKR
jgi:hypothetical protein